MIINFTPLASKTAVEYCLSCHAPNSLSAIQTTGKQKFTCNNCGASSERRIVIDPKIVWSTDSQKRYWHKSVGAILVNNEGEILLFELTKFPYGISFPAGHIDVGEEPAHAVCREVYEETSLNIVNPTLLSHTKIHGDSCSRGSDDHEWWLFGARVNKKKISLDQKEGTKPTWVSLEDLSLYDMPLAAQTFLKPILPTIKDFVKPSVS